MLYWLFFSYYFFKFGFAQLFVSCRPSRPSTQPSSRPSKPSSQPSVQPSGPTVEPSSQPTRQPSRQPTSQPSRLPTNQPTEQPTRQPTSRPTRPTSKPSSDPTVSPNHMMTTSLDLSFHSHPNDLLLLLTYLPFTHPLHLSAIHTLTLFINYYYVFSLRF